MVRLFWWVWSRVGIEVSSRDREGEWVYSRRQESKRRGGGSMGFGWPGHRTGMSPFGERSRHCQRSCTRAVRPATGRRVLEAAAILDVDAGWALGRSSSGFRRGRRKWSTEVMTKATVVGCRRPWSGC